MSTVKKDFLLSTAELVGLFAKALSIRKGARVKTRALVIKIGWNQVVLLSPSENVRNYLLPFPSTSSFLLGTGGGEKS